jgi:hypothetical protein
MRVLELLMSFVDHTNPGAYRMSCRLKGTIAAILAVLSIVPASVHASPVTYDFTGTLESGDPVAGYFNLLFEPDLFGSGRSGAWPTRAFEFSTPALPDSLISGLAFHTFEYGSTVFLNPDFDGSNVTLSFFPQTFAGSPDGLFTVPGGLNLTFALSFQQLGTLPSVMVLCENLGTCPNTGTGRSYAAAPPRGGSPEVWLRFTSGTAVARVPEPGTLVLLAAGVFACGLTRRSRGASSRTG